MYMQLLLCTFVWLGLHFYLYVRLSAPPTLLSVYRSVCQSVCVSKHLFLLPFICLFAFLFIYRPFYPSVILMFICLSFCSSARLLVFLSIHLTVCLSTHLPIYGYILKASGLNNEMFTSVLFVLVSYIADVRLCLLQLCEAMYSIEFINISTIDTWKIRKH